MNILQLDYEFRVLTESSIQGELKLFIAILARIVLDAKTLKRLIENYDNRKKMFPKYPPLVNFLYEREDLYRALKNKWVEDLCEMTDIDYGRFVEKVEDELEIGAELLKKISEDISIAKYVYEKNKERELNAEFKIREYRKIKRLIGKGRREAI